MSESNKAAEQCIVCGSLTGRAGRLDDSIYLYVRDGAEIGPLCEECADVLDVEAWRDEMSMMRKDRDEWKAKAEANELDRLRMNYLERKVVTVALPLVHGSRTVFCCGPSMEDGDEYLSLIRSQIDAARSSEKEKE